jgi:serpin B
MKKTLMALLVVAVVVGLAGCAQPAAGEVVTSEKQRVTSPDVSEAELRAQVDGNSAFAFDLYHGVLEEENVHDNLFYSPYSISLALTMTYAGARGETAQQMADTLHLVLPDANLHAAFNKLDMELASRGKGAAGKDGEEFRLNVVNAIWGQEGYPFLAGFLDTLAEDYGAGLRTLDFSGETEKSRQTINRWVSEQTEERIENLLEKGDIGPDTVIVLTNAIYFNGAWLHPFEQSLTRDQAFHRLDGTTVMVPMMRQTESFGYTEGENYQAAELLYDGGELSMVVLLPREGEFHSFEAGLDSQRVTNVLADLSRTPVALTMPKFNYESKAYLKKVLSEMGMPVAFTPEADFSGMVGPPAHPWIDNVIHQSFVDVDEAGTEAAAATAVVMVESAAPGEPVEVTVDRPFVFLIRDIETDSFLFVGRVLDPAT